MLHVDAYDLPGSEIGFDIRVEAHIEVHEGDYHYDEANGRSNGLFFDALEIWKMT